MATAVETNSPARTPNPATNLALASLAGAVYLLAALAVVFYVLPALWVTHVSPHLGGAREWGDILLRYTAVVAALVGFVWVGRALAGSPPPAGLRGGIFLILAVVAVVALIALGVGAWAERVFEGATGQIVAAAVAVGLLFGAYRLLSSGRAARWMAALEEQGWFHATPFKRALGQKVRRLTLLGILLIGATGIYSLYYQDSVPDHWSVTIPFTGGDGPPGQFTVLPNAKYAVPGILFFLTLWAAYRVVNMPAFAEFLIATEAEMNKVSWSTRRRLAQDTLVVLVTTVFMALFLLVVDLFWGWLLSLPTVGVLPAKSTDTKGGEVHEAKW